MNIVAKSLFVLAFLAPLAGRAQSRTAVTVAAGPSIPLGTLRDTNANGVDINVGLVRGSDDSPVGFRLDFGYDRFPGRTVNAVKSAERRVVAGSANLVLTGSGYSLKPYLLGGVGAYKMTSKPATADAKTRFGFDFGVGFTLPIASSAVFVESRVNSISQRHAKPVRFIPIVLGMLF